VQTLRWLVRPISFLESCRRRFGDTFSVRFLGFETPMVMLSAPEAIRALYINPEHRLPPGRSVALLPIMGPRSLLLLEDASTLRGAGSCCRRSTARACVPTSRSSGRSSRGTSTAGREGGRSRCIRGCSE
jgi:hypothetical protein